MNRHKHTLIAAALTAFVFSASPLASNAQSGPPGHAKAKSPKAEGRHDRGKHLGWYKQQYKRGDRIVWVDVDPVYYVEDYRVYRLSPPPVGYRWVRPMDDHYLLVNVATGLIAEALGY